MKEKPCGNDRCVRGGTETGLRAVVSGQRYCSDNCAAAVRNRAKRKRDRAGIKLKKCQACKGSGKVKR